MQSRFSFGVLSTAKIAREKVVPEMMRSRLVEVAAIASRREDTARKTARELGIEKAYGSYEQLLADPEIDAIYNPLPNHLHVPWSVKAAEAGKHVLCEKPIAPTRDEALPLIEAAERYGVLIQEAFMVVTHPQWLTVKEWIEAGKIGELRAIQGVFSYFNADPDNIRNRADIGGGGLLDIGCYPIAISRFVTGREPVSVQAVFDFDADFRTDRLGSAVLQFSAEDGFPLQSSFVFSTQMTPFQRMSFYGTTGRRLEVTLPFNPPPDIATEIWFDDASTAPIASPIRHRLECCGQYQLAAEAFARAARGQTPPAISLDWSLANMAVIDAAFRAARSQKSEAPVRL